MAYAHHRSRQGEEFDPIKLMPERYRPAAAKPRPKTEAEMKRETNCALLLMETALGG